MYYTVEGKKLLFLIYLTGALLGSLMINICVKKGVFHFYDFLDYTSYISTITENLTGNLFSYILMIRLRQLLLFILMVLILSPYVTYCIFTLVFSLVLGSFISLMTIRFGFMGILYGTAFLFPQILCYGIMLFAAYYYIFHSYPKSQIYRMKAGFQGRISKTKGLMERKLFVAALCIFMFAAGVLSEGYINPLILKKIMPL